MTKQTETPVVVIGAGPVGSVLALELARHGVECVLVERSTTASRHPKMDYVSGRSMELLRRLGLAGPIRRRAIGPEHRADFLWLRGYDEPPVARWDHPSVGELIERYERIADGSAPVEPYSGCRGRCWRTWSAPGPAPTHWSTCGRDGRSPARSAPPTV